MKICIAIALMAALPLSLATAAAGAERESVKVLVAYYSRTGHTAALASAVAEGARKVAQAQVTVKTVAEVKCAELLAADALIVGSPVYWSNMAGEVKAFFDRWTDECKVVPPGFPMRDKVGAAFVTAGDVSSGKEIALLTMLAAMIGNRMIVLGEGQALGATATTGEGKLPLEGKALKEGSDLGERVARVALTLKRGRPTRPD
jgi:NAD(P)H dehydrogenase (quinone)